MRLVFSLPSSTTFRVRQHRRGRRGCARAWGCLPSQRWSTRSGRTASTRQGFRRIDRYAWTTVTRCDVDFRSDHAVLGTDLPSNLMKFRASWTHGSSAPPGLCVVSGKRGLWCNKSATALSVFWSCTGEGPSSSRFLGTRASSGVLSLFASWRLCVDDSSGTAGASAVTSSSNLAHAFGPATHHIEEPHSMPSLCSHSPGRHAKSRRFGAARFHAFRRSRRRTPTAQVLP